MINLGNIRLEQAKDGRILAYHDLAKEPIEVPAHILRRMLIGLFRKLL